MLETGLVTKSTGSWYTVQPEKGNRLVSCTLKGKLRLKGVKTTSPVAVGDDVDFEPSADSGQGVITHVHPRKNYIIRRSTKLSRQYHILAANLDQAVLMIAVENPTTPLEFIDRFLATCEAYEVPAALIINKMDLLTEENRQKAESIQHMYRAIGYPVECISLTHKKNIDAVHTLLKNKRTLLAGNSGVGKSSLINYLNPALNLKTATISTHHKTGKHTTTFAEMFSIDADTTIIDTPGIKGFGVIDMEKEEMYHFFPEIFRTAEQCKFHNCLHINEPGCAVVNALNEGKIHPQRYRSYVNMLFDEEEKYRNI